MNLKKNRLHYLIWTLYMCYEAISLGIVFNDLGSPIIYLSHYLIIIGYFYFNSNFSLPQALKDKKKVIWVLPLVIVLELFLYIIAQYLVSELLITIEIAKNPVKIDSLFIVRNLYRGLLFMGFSTGYYYLKTYLKERKKTEDLEKERLEKIIQRQQIEQELVSAQNAFLKAQINPHFLFNTLDFIYHKVNKHSEIAGEAVIKLAQMMRFAIDSNEMEQTIDIADEIEQVENLLYLYQIRKNNDLNVHFAYTDEVKQLRLIPLVILTLVENIFKHGDISNADDIAFIDLKIEEGAFSIQTVNLINSHKIKDSTNAGLNNIQKRLNFAYGDEITFDHQILTPHFKVDIKIPVQLLKGPV